MSFSHTSLAVTEQALTTLSDAEAIPEEEQSRQYTIILLELITEAVSTGREQRADSKRRAQLLGEVHEAALRLDPESLGKNVQEVPLGYDCAWLRGEQNIVVKPHHFLAGRS